MVVRSPSAPTADRFIDATLDLITETGGSPDVNLRQIARRVGCAHTNAYNYFPSFDALLWAAFRRALAHYGAYLLGDLDDEMPPYAYVEQVVTNLATYPVEHPGLFRFIGSDPIDIDRIPSDILQSVGAMKAWLFEVLGCALGSDVEPVDAERIANIVLAYVDGETLNLINGRVVPGEDVRGRIVENAMWMVRDLSGQSDLEDVAAPCGSYPILDLSGVEGAR